MTASLVFGGGGHEAAREPLLIDGLFRLRASYFSLLVQRKVTKRKDPQVQAAPLRRGNLGGGRSRRVGHAGHGWPVCPRPGIHARLDPAPDPRPGTRTMGPQHQKHSLRSPSVQAIGRHRRFPPLPLWERGGGEGSLKVRRSAAAYSAPLFRRLVERERMLLTLGPLAAAPAWGSGAGSSRTGRPAEDIQAMDGLYVRPVAPDHHAGRPASAGLRMQGCAFSWLLLFAQAKRSNSPLGEINQQRSTASERPRGRHQQTLKRGYA